MADTHDAARLAEALSQETLLRIADDLPLAVALLSGPDFVHRYGNREYRKIAPGKRMLGRSWREVWPEIADDTLPLLRSVVESGEVVSRVDLRLDIRRSYEGDLEECYFSFTFAPLELDGSKAIVAEGTETTEKVLARREAERLAALTQQTATALSDVFESMADGFIALDPEWRFNYVNGRAEDLLHKCRDELLGGVIWDALPDLVGTVFYDQLQTAMCNQEAVSFEEYYSPNDMWASIHAIPSSGGLSVYIANITSQKQAEADLATSEAQLRAVIDNSPAVIYMKDLEGRFIRVNDEFVGRFGIEKEDAVGKTDFELLPEHAAQTVRKNDERVLRSGTPCQFEEEVSLPDGRSILYLTTKFPLKDASGRIYGTAGISTNMNERIRQERALAESEQRFRKVFEEGPLGVALVDRRLTLQQVNERYAEMLGYTKDEMVGKTIGEITYGPDRESTLQLPEQLLTGSIPYYRVEKRSLRKDGRPLWVSIHGSLIRDDAGKPMFILALAEDIDQRKAAEEAVRDRDRAIRAAYSNVISAVTGGKLILMTPDELDDVIGRRVSDSWEVNQFSELAEIRHALLRSLVLDGMDSDTADTYVLAACEGFTNAIKHGGGGEISVHRNGKRLQVVIRDHGPGIDFEHLPKATLVAGFSTASSLGMGFTIMLEACDRLLLSTQPGLTELVLEANDVPAPSVETERPATMATR